MIAKPLIGADPEYFLFDTVEGHSVSAHGLIPGDKLNPFKVKKGAIQLDGTAVEFNIDPTDDPDEFASNIQTVLDQIRDMIHPRYIFQFTPTVTYPKDYFNQVVPKRSKELGCTPDFNSTNLKIKKPNIIPEGKEALPFRTASGHIHIGWTKDRDTVNDETHLFDCMYLSSLYHRILEPTRKLWDSDKERHRLYGAGGAYRPKPYGVEYRGLSNAWLNYPKLWPWLHKAASGIFTYAASNEYNMHASDFYGVSVAKSTSELRQQYMYLLGDHYDLPEIKDGK